MFSKETDKPETFIGLSTGSKEELKVRGTLRINGIVKGQLDADRVILSETGCVKGEIKAKSILIGGKMDGKSASSGIGGDRVQREGFGG